MLPTYKWIAFTLFFILLSVQPTFADPLNKYFPVPKFTKDSTDWMMAGRDYEARKDYDNAIAAYTKGIEINSDPVNTQGLYWFRGVVYDKQNKLDLAIKDFTKAIELGTSDMITMFAYNRRGWAYYKRGDNNLAIDDYNKSIQIDSLYDAPYNNRGLAYERKAEYDLALADYQRAININRDKTVMQWSYTNRAALYLRKGQYDLAETDINKAIELNPQIATPYFIKAEVLHILEKRQEAIEMYEQFLQYATPGDVWIQIAKNRIRKLSDN